MHGQKEQIGAAEQVDRRAVGQVARHVDGNRRAGGDGAVGLGRDAGEHHFRRLRQRRIAAHRLLEPFEEEDVGAREDVNREIASAEQTASPADLAQPKALVRVEVSGVHDAELAVGSLRLWAVEVGLVEAVRDRDHEAGAKLRELPLDPLGCFMRVHDDGVRSPEQFPHPSEIDAPMELRGVQPHLVERPGVLKVGDPRFTERRRDTRHRCSRFVRDDRAIDEIAVPAGRQRGGQNAFLPPAQVGGREHEAPLEGSPQPGADRRLWARYAMYLCPRGDVGIEGVVGRRPAIGRAARSGHHDRLVAELRHVADEFRVALDSPAADRRKMVGNDENPGHQRRSGGVSKGEAAVNRTSVSSAQC